MLHSIILTEPTWGKNILTLFNTRASSSETLGYIVGISADVFVFTYPVLLIGLYLYAYRNNNDNLKKGAIQIMGSVITATIINICIQLFIWKDRPESLAGIKLILNHVPTISFPSDHAAVSMAIAVGTRLVLKTRNKEQGTRNILIFSLFCFSIIMGLCRIAVAVHRPTDILAGWIIGIVGGYAGYYIVGLSFINNLLKRVTKTIDYIIGFLPFLPKQSTQNNG